MFPKTSCGLNYISKDFSCNLLDLDVKRRLQDNILYYLVIFLANNTRQKYVGIDMIHMPHVHSNIFIITKLGVMNSQFYRILRFCNFKDSFISRMVNLIFLLKNKSCPSKILYKGIECCLIKNNVFLDSFWKSGEFLVSWLDLCFWCPFICANMIDIFGMKSQHSILIIPLIYIVLCRLVISQWVVLEVYVK
jgi:hypothetical protein